jgi:phospholipase/carboxylesterase
MTAGSAKDTATVATAATSAPTAAATSAPAPPKGERILNIAGLRTTAIGDPNAPMTLVLLHGYAMRPSDLSPFAHSIGIPAYFLLPQGPLASPDGGHAWWDVDLEARAAALAAGPRDLANDYPQGLTAARHQFGEFLAAVTAEVKPRRTVIGGFSQGGMLALDHVLRGNQLAGTRVDGLALLSTSRLALQDWEPRRERLRHLPVFLSHGSTDRDLAFATGERLRDFLLESAAQLTWTPFDGGHEIPLVVWRGLRKFLAALLK